MALYANRQSGEGENFVTCVRLRNPPGPLTEAIRIGEEAGCYPVAVKYPLQVRVLSLPL